MLFPKTGQDFGVSSVERCPHYFIIALHIAMTTVIARPSSLLSRIRVEKLENFNLFKFDDELQARMEELLERKKADLLTPEEIIELEEIGELDRIFTHINAMIVAQK